MKQRYPLLVAAVLVLGACTGEEVAELPVFQALPLELRDISVDASAAGVVEAVQLIEVKSKASGEITEVFVETGDQVGRGQLLVRVDPRVPTNAVIQAEADSVVAAAQVANAQAQMRRSEQLFDTQSITEQEYENARLQAANANAQMVRAERSLEDARIAFEDTEVRSPITGFVIQRTVEQGSVIQSATSNVGGGAVLMTMANLDTVQVRALVDETDIGKISAGMTVSISVDAYPNQDFEGRVLMIEPQATVTQNVTMFPVLVRIPNPGVRLKPGMNAEVDVSIGNREGVLAVPYAALRTDQDVESAALVLGLTMEDVQAQLEGDDEPIEGTNGDHTPANTISMRGTVLEVPDGVDMDVARSMERKAANGEFRSFTEAERTAMRTIMSANSDAFSGGPGGRRGGGGDQIQAQMSGEYIVFVLRPEGAVAVRVETGLTDLDYAEVRSGLTEADTVLLLPSASLISSQQSFSERVSRVTGGGGIPGVRSR